MLPNVQFNLVEDIRDNRSLDYLVEVQTIQDSPVKTGLDRFAVLRKVGFTQIIEQPQIKGAVLPTDIFAGVDVLSSMTALEFDWAQAFASGFPFELAPFDQVDPYTHSAMLRGLNRSGVVVDPDLLIAQMGVSDSSDALIQDALSRSSMEVVLSRPKLQKKSGIVIAQFMFLGEIGQAGKGDSGGLGVFLASLGNAMARESGVERVYTFVLNSGDESFQAGKVDENHAIIPIRLPFAGKMGQREMMVYEQLLENAVWQALKDRNIQPDIFHIRYADHGSLAVLRVAKRLDKKVVFTLTADPHRTLVNQYAQPFLNNAGMQELDFALQRVYVADQLLEESDGIVVMPNSAGIEPLKAYFPQFHLDPIVQEKPLAVLAEGIELNTSRVDRLMGSDELIQILNQAHADAHGVLPDSGFFQRPLLLNVGRLHPIKQQHHLVEAWVASDLWQTYNLMLIGGNLSDPGPAEAEMLASIFATLDRYPEARRHFCLLPAMENQMVRDIERALIQHLPANLPHVYVCSSLKEEFGIAVLESMDAGFMVIGPERGGLSSYIDHGYNGFLMDTRSVANMAAALKSILTETNEPEDLRFAASAGQATVRTRFDIETTARAFIDFYQQVLS
jgi:glycosyltransferase involved in cell wall biosynthesis